MTRADRLLVTQQLVRSRTRAQRLIRGRRVFIVTEDGLHPVLRASEQLPDTSRFLIEPDPEERYVSRAGLKLEALLKATGVSLADAIVLDVGQSTGGFTDCALQAGATRVIGIEVGHDQLDSRLRSDPRVECLEGVNARALPDDRLHALMPAGATAAVMDVSFISQTLILPELARLLPPGGALLSLVKPQFELSPERIGSGGLVRDAGDYKVVRSRLEQACRHNGFTLHHWQESPITGGDGNREFLLYATRLDHSLS
ncbi:23S rRNA (cytidine1920-2'-O)/16S rRNA (cytidine1409-2'-O)-methyltransferase [Kushneria sinocarnis]|uniref:23S rRNA (Cytidine1920-2'-O)/16S rRNA (Cytidine1409-2'-O)-methyltransferase n=1 Tax=Kushneria sinocarnis TaxID=595502 RepID=A0A420WTV9_9GAMM|nr:TlyA family RNA methyltransferase [Kushneria sinocarnis]RKQ96381.1 23S rRNA (cytidine1920-2'-O)/16S rRNA (cytidine1409-2'-O)-methyltransferase [Kushneria sinocarnis]